MAQPDKLAVVWTSGDRDVALKMVMMYTHNAKIQNWWKDVLLIVWGHSAELLSVDVELGNYVGKMLKDGVRSGGLQGLRRQLRGQRRAGEDGSGG